MHDTKALDKIAFEGMLGILMDFDDSQFADGAFKCAFRLVPFAGLFLTTEGLPVSF